MQVKNVVEMPHNDHLPLIEASRCCLPLVFVLSCFQSGVRLEHQFLNLAFDYQFMCWLGHSAVETVWLQHVKVAILLFELHNACCST